MKETLYSEASINHRLIVKTIACVLQMSITSVWLGSIILRWFEQIEKGIWVSNLSSELSIAYLIFVYLLTVSVLLYLSALDEFKKVGGK